MILKNMV
jgi:uncharacterized membrane protein YeaQ/YmgE (transglycosylase-associated protein family)